MPASLRFSLLVVCFLLLSNILGAQHLEIISVPELFRSGLVSTEASEIKITFSPDGTRMLWGSTNRKGGSGGWNIWESVWQEGTWSEARCAAFNSDSNDFDPFFSPDGKGIYFFSNRTGGLGGDDIWFSVYNPATGLYDEPMNAGPNVNSAGDEWAPIISPDGSTLLFSTDGRQGLGMHDLFTCRWMREAWATAELAAGDVNSTDEDFDAAFLHDGNALVFTRRAKDQSGADLYVSFLQDGRYTIPTRLDANVNVPDAWNLGPAIHPGEPTLLYFTSHREGSSAGRLDIYRVSYRIVGE